MHGPGCNLYLEAVGGPLIIMQQQKLQITEAGMALFRTCQQVFGHFEDYQDYLAELKGGVKIITVRYAGTLLP